MRHAIPLSLSDDECVGQEDTPDEEESPGRDECEADFFKWTYVTQNIEWFWAMRQPWLHGKIRDDQQKENQECANSHRPSKANPGNETIYHDREEHTPKARAAGYNAQG